MFTRIIILFLVAHTICHLHNKHIINQKLSQTKLYYGSTVRIKGLNSGYHLHSHEVRYPRGSGYQSVTGMSGQNDYNSLWTIRQAHNEPIKTYCKFYEILDDALKCGDTIRLQHALTKRNLHSEEIFNSMLNYEQEVSAFGNYGNGNDNDNWIISCNRNKDQQDFYAGYTFDLIHENTGKYLKMASSLKYNRQNWQNCPFENQIEVSAIGVKNVQTQLKMVGGVFYGDSQKKIQEDLENSDL